MLLKTILKYIMKIVQRMKCESRYEGACAPAFARSAASVQFHPSEKKTLLPDGSLLVILRCRGERELMWELQHPDWAGNVTITAL